MVFSATSLTIRGKFVAKQKALLDTISTQGTGTSPAFARHETFHPRYGWLKKGFDAVKRDPHVFLRDDAPVVLGVGKNMVRSIRYWCEAFKLNTYEDKPDEFGKRLLEKWDSYLEDPASLWVLHWNLLKPPCIATAWWVIFNDFRKIEFTSDDLVDALKNYCAGLSRNVAESSLRKDVTCILRMYTSQPQKSRPTEDTLDCPFAELGLIQSVEDSKHYIFRTGSKNSLPAEVVVFACLDSLGIETEEVEKDQGTISIARLLYEPNSPGMAFKLSESTLCEAIETVARLNSSIQLSDSAGLLQLSFKASPSMLADSILDGYYQNRSII
ncbi:MAG: DUF4007 family protein [Synechococcaceae cyanobacterium SM2_3_1]|nr:DUF4007 family protein [Synechococcaceae cyanobacterium SM2_3_1]